MPLAARTCLALPSTEQAGERGHLRFYPSSPSRLGSRLASVRDRSEHQPGLLPSPDALAVAPEVALKSSRTFRPGADSGRPAGRPFRWASVEDTAWSWQARKSGARRGRPALRARLEPRAVPTFVPSSLLQPGRPAGSAGLGREAPSASDCVDSGWVDFASAVVCRLSGAREPGPFPRCGCFAALAQAGP